MVTLILLKIRPGPNGLVVKEDLYADKEQGPDGENAVMMVLLFPKKNHVLTIPIDAVRIIFTIYKL